MKPRLLNGCAKSKFIADEFEARGWEAWTCDILPAEGPGNHIQDDVLKHLDDGWDMAIFHPPCQYLSYAGMGHWNDPGRAELREDALALFVKLYNAPIGRIAIENPKGYPMAVFRPADQRIEPFMFGDHERKRTYLWLRGLPLLNPTVALWSWHPPVIESSGKRRWFTDRGNSSKEYRSRTFPGISKAMADQWAVLGVSACLRVADASA